MNTSQYDCDAVFKALEPAAPPPMSELGVNLYCTFMLLFTITAATGNIFVVVAVAKFRILRKQSNAYIVSLAFADIGVAVIVMPLQMYETWNGMWDLPKWFCYFRNVFDGGMCDISIYSLCVLAVDRYMAVCHPFIQIRITRAMTVIAIAVCWITPLTMWTVLNATGWHSAGLEDFEFCLMEAGACVYVGNTLSSSVIITITFIFPLCLMFVLYAKIFATARRHARAIEDLNVTEEEKSKHNAFLKSAKAAKTIGIVIGIYFLSWMPIYIAMTVDLITHFQLIPYFILQALAWLAYLNSMMNPFLYYTFSQEFKYVFKSMMGCNVTPPNIQNG